MRLTQWLLLLLLQAALLPSGVAAAPQFPELSGRVVDRAELLSAATEAQLDAQLAEHESASSNQVVIVTLPDLQGYAISDFANLLGRHWGIGQADKDNGVLLLVAPTERKVRIEVGYGLEGALTDATSSDIIRRQILPQFREGDYPGGIQSGINSIISAIEGEYVVEPGTSTSDSRSGLESYFPLLFIGLIAVFEVLKRLGLRRLGTSAFPTAMFGIATTAISGKILIGIFSAVVVFLIVFFMQKNGDGGSGGSSTRNDNHPGSRDTGFGGGSSGGGGFGGGGGSFGGGGASGGW